MWSWNPIGACFISEKWCIYKSHHRSALFGATCLFAILMVIIFELLRQLARENNRHIRRSSEQRATFKSSNGCVTLTPCGADGQREEQIVAARMTQDSDRFVPFGARGPGTIRPTGLQQAGRALLHLIQIIVAVVIVLLALSFNGPILLCLAIGALLGYFFFTWDTIH